MSESKNRIRDIQVNVSLNTDKLQQRIDKIIEALKEFRQAIEFDFEGEEE